MQCFVCSSESLSLFHNKVWSSPNGQVFRCNNCDLTFVTPMMSKEESEKFYKNYNEHLQRRGVVVSSDPAELHSKSRLTAQIRYELVKNILEPANYIMEIGSSTGAFLELLSGKHCTGVEPGDIGRKYSRNITDDIFSDISQVPLDRRFDVICMFHVFEHINDPIQFLHTCKSLLSKGGCILIEVPHIDDPLISLYNCAPFKDFHFQPMHPYIYSSSSLEYVFSRANLKQKELIYHQRYGLENHLSWLSHGRPGGDDKFKSLLSNNKEYQEALEKNQTTDTLFYIAETL